MGPRSLFTTAASIAALLTPARDAAQIGTTDRLAVARSALHAMKLDSAALLARQVLDSATAAPRLDRIQAWLLLGVVAFYQGRDSATASDFREGLRVTTPPLSSCSRLNDALRRRTRLRLRVRRTPFWTAPEAARRTSLHHDSWTYRQGPGSRWTHSTYGTTWTAASRFAS